MSDETRATTAAMLLSQPRCGHKVCEVAAIAVAANTQRPGHDCRGARPRATAAAPPTVDYIMTPALRKASAATCFGPQSGATRCYGVERFEARPAQRAGGVTGRP